MLKHLNKLKFPALKYGTAALLLAVPLYPKFPFIKVPGTFVSIRLEDFLIAVVSIIWLVNALPNYKKFLNNKINQAIIIFLGIGLISVLAAVFITDTAPLHIGALHWLRRVEYFMAFFIGVTVVRSKKDLAFFVKLLFIVVIAAFAYGVGQKYLHLPIVTTQNFEYSKGVALRYTQGGHLPSTFAGHYDLATYLVYVLPLFFTLLFLGKSELKKIFRVSSGRSATVIIFLSLGVGYWLLVNTVSRISIVSFLIAVSVGIYLIRKYKMIPIFIIFSLIIAGSSNSLINRYSRVLRVTVERVLGLDDETTLTLASPILAQTQGELPERRFSQTPTPVPSVPIFEDRSTSIRINVEWPRAIRAFSKNPLLGTGYSSISLATDGDYLRLLGEVGILGFFAFFLVMFRIASKLLESLPFPKKLDLRHAYIAGIMGGVIGVFLNAVFIDVFEASKFATIFWLLLGFAVSTVNLITNEKSK